MIRGVDAYLKERVIYDKIRPTKEQFRSGAAGHIAEDRHTD